MGGGATPPACSSLDRVHGGPEGLPRVKLSHEAPQLTTVAVETAVKLAGLAQSNRTPSNTGRLQDDLKRESQRARRKILVSAKLARARLGSPEVIAMGYVGLHQKSGQS